MNILDKTLKGLDGLALRLVWLGGALLVLAALIVTVDVILRKIFNIRAWLCVLILAVQELVGHHYWQK